MSFFFFAISYLFTGENLVTKVLPGMMIAFGLFIQRRRLPSEWSWIPAFLAGGYLLQPYYTLLEDIQIPTLFEREFYVLPLIGLVIYLQICLRKKYSFITSRLQWGVLVVVALLLVQDGLESSTIYDAIILGSLSLLSLLVGVFLRIKAYFFVGSGVLLLNVMLQTRPYWGNLPWWAYLVMAGSILITVASLYEWHKQKNAKGETTVFVRLKEKVLHTLNQWN